MIDVAKQPAKTMDYFVVLCEQYENLGALLQCEAHAISAGQFDVAVECKRRIMTQYNEIGEQLKVLGPLLEENEE